MLLTSQLANYTYKGNYMFVYMQVATAKSVLFIINRCGYVYIHKLLAIKG